MKKIIMILMVILVLFKTTEQVYADSPLTSTHFSKAYYDIDIVGKASKRNFLTEEMAQFLADENNPIDVKAAVINALSWRIEKKNNTERYCMFIYGKSLKDIDVTLLSGQQQFCLGYMLALDDITINNMQAVEYLEMAKSNMPESRTVAVVSLLVEATYNLIDGWQERYSELLEDTNLNNDLPDEAIYYISDYMIYYNDIPLDIPKTGVHSYGWLYGIGALLFMAAAVTIKVNRVSKDKKK